MNYRLREEDGTFLRQKKKVQVAFALDCCDREVMGYTATAVGGIDGEMIRDLIANCVAF